MATCVGANVALTYTADQLAEGGIGFRLGDRFETVDGKTFIFVTAGAAITQYDAVGIDEAYTATELTTAAAADGHKIGVAQVAFDSGDYGWVQIRGVCELNVAGNYAVDGILYTTSTAGLLDDAVATTLSRIHGLIGTEAGTTGATTVAAFMAIEPFADAPTG